VESGLHQSTLPFVQIAIASQQTLTNRILSSAFEGWRFLKLVGMFDQHILNVFWIIQLIHAAWPNREVNHITIFALIFEQKANAILLQLP